MPLDNASLLIAIAFSGTALMLALLIGWSNARHESYLVHGAIGIGLVVGSLAFMGLRTGYDPMINAVAFSGVLAGFSFIHSSSRRFFDKSAPLGPPIGVGVAAILLTALPMLAGFSGVGTIMLNGTAAVLMALCGWQFWAGRAESQAAMTVNAALYGLTAISFAACSAMLIADSSWVLTAPPDNWAEDFNSIMALTGLTGIGAITLTLHHSRSARRHRKEAQTDMLTGVLNRRALFERVGENDIVAGLPVLMFDLDHFKQINDRRGHAAGDEVLRRFADVLRSYTRSVDAVARLGGEEFCVLLPGCDAEGAERVAQRIRQAFAALDINLGDGATTATVSAGLAIGDADESFASVLSRADAALYRAKSAGRNNVRTALRRAA
jgi:diguanylate cyclase (GGDEF)-like protein